MDEYVSPNVPNSVKFTVFAQQGRHDTPIMMKFDREEHTICVSNAR